mmetsp:Transcript_41147/g.98539  ORF Transcript_41147/g.98539 Transcript_41147/m.98539 type:complete len:500 (+) Transcript_41147:187-1686(+)|eukprot:CAMPEP_0113457696 /NCGR_PEP_ID=MMETSP0014_2-20120614/9541_1 /TAXON_ID=2857 /ORGANISM="Nitzschia sp." /LENGTH=499 /DNA_ID=CAMNT_0000349199 /DNA_START=251 /DNA_END=1750 /DNA_ORIENTATION=+ /assembly_acc=CAM_ASM_000159
MAKSSHNKSGSSTKSKKVHEKPPPLEQYIKPAVAVAVLLVVYQFIKGILFEKEIQRLDLMDELSLRQVVFGEALDDSAATTTTAEEEGGGGEVGSSNKKKSSSSTQNNFVVLCHPEQANWPISSVFGDAASQLMKTDIAEFRVVDCELPLQSGKTLAERFKLNVKTRPTVFVSGKIGQPKQVPSKHLKTGKMLAKALTNLLTPKAEKIETTQDLRTKCLDKPICGLLLKGSKQSPNYVKDAMSKLVTEHPAVAFGAVDSSNLYVKGLEAEYLDEFQQDTPRFVVFQKVSGSTSSAGKDDDNKKKDTGRLKTSLVTLDENVSVGYGPMSNLVASVVTSQAKMQKVPALPTVKTRTKKLVEEERKKRQRRNEQKDRASGGGSGGGGGAFSGGESNDGTAEGRRAERERRREEHRRSNNVKPKTPEEIAEMERRRRQRMEEESAKWNVADEDLGDLLNDDDGRGGEGSGGDSIDWDVEDDDNGEDGGGDGGDEDDEDVMDLD